MLQNRRKDVYIVLNSQMDDRFLLIKTVEITRQPAPQLGEEIFLKYMVVKLTWPHYMNTFALFN